MGIGFFIFLLLVIPLIVILFSKKLSKCFGEWFEDLFEGNKDEEGEEGEEDEEDEEGDEEPPKFSDENIKALIAQIEELKQQSITTSNTENSQAGNQGTESPTTEQTGPTEFVEDPGTDDMASNTPPEAVPAQQSTDGTSGYMMRRINEPIPFNRVIKF